MNEPIRKQKHTRLDHKVNLLLEIKFLKVYIIDVILLEGVNQPGSQYPQRKHLLNLVQIGNHSILIGNSWGEGTNQIADGEVRTRHGGQVGLSCHIHMLVHNRTKVHALLERVIVGAQSSLVVDLSNQNLLISRSPIDKYNRVETKCTNRKRSQVIAIITLMMEFFRKLLFKDTTILPNPLLISWVKHIRSEQNIQLENQADRDRPTGG